MDFITVSSHIVTVCLQKSLGLREFAVPRYPVLDGMEQAAVALYAREVVPNAGTRQVEWVARVQGFYARGAAWPSIRRLRSLLGVKTARNAAHGNGRRQRGGTMGKLSKAAWLYIAAVVIAAVAVVARGPFGGIDWAQVITLGVLLAASESTATLLESRSLAWSSRPRWPAWRPSS